jgi:integrase
MAAHRKSIVRETIERLDGKMAIGESRREAKKALRGEHGPLWSVSDGRIHSYKTRSVYQEHAIRFAKWARQTYHILTLEQLDLRANELATLYLQEHIQEGKSPYTLQTERAALRLFFGRRELACTVALPRRTRAKITRSRGPVAHDRYFQPAHWQPLLNFLHATGLRRQEIHDLRCKEVYQGVDGRLYVHVKNGKGGRSRNVPVLPGCEHHVLSAIEGKHPDARIFDRIPRHLDVHSYRREFAQALYLLLASNQTLPPASGRLRPQDYDRTAVKYVSQALGHNRLDVVLKHYLR